MGRLFSIDEANALLPTLERQLERLRQIGRSSRDLNEKLADLEAKARSNGRDHASEIQGLRESLAENRREASVVIEEITALGCDVKSVDEGLVDFPSGRAGRVVYLCWKSGEERIRYWHELDAGFAGRRLLDGETGPAQT